MFARVALLALILDQLIRLGVERWLPGAVNTTGRWLAVPLLPSLIIVLLVVVVAQLYSRRYQLPLGLVAGGSLSNMLTYFITKGPVDYLQLPAQFIINVADICITIGCLLLALEVIKKPSR